MIDKNVKLVDLARLTQFKQLCDIAYATKADVVNGCVTEVTADEYDEDEILAILNPNE